MIYFSIYKDISVDTKAKNLILTLITVAELKKYFVKNLIPADYIVAVFTV